MRKYQCPPVPKEALRSEPRSRPLFSRSFRCRDCRSLFAAPDFSLIQLLALGLLSLLVTAMAIAWVVRQQTATADYEVADQGLPAEPTTTAPKEHTLDEAEENYRKGLELLRRSAQRGARSELPKAAKWLRQAADKGHVRAQLMLGVLHEDGSGVIQDYEQALEWYRIAAMQGETVAMHRVGSMLRRGVGADKDLIEAYAWCNIAAARGHREAAIDRDQIGNSLSREEIKEAQEQSRAFNEELPTIVAKPFTLPAGL